MFGSLRSRGMKIIPQNLARERLSSGETVYLIDVRSPEEYKQLHIKNSISLPLDQIKSGVSKIIKDKDAEILIYCYSGMRAAAACRLLAQMGYTNAGNMGGIQNWKYETEKGS
jgi:Rhodanese-related sulfurtransferase